MTDSNKFNPSPSDLLVMTGLSHLNKGELNEAEAAFLKALKEEPDHSGANAFLSDLEKHRGNLDKALEYADRAIEAYPASPYLMNRAEIKLALGKRPESVDDLKLCIANDKRGQFIEKAASILAMNFIEEDDFNEALKHLDAVIKLNPTNASALKLRSVCRKKLGDDEGALNDQARSQECGFDPDNPMAGIFSPPEGASPKGSIKSQRSMPDDTTTWAATVFLDENAKLHLAYIRHAGDTVLFGFAVISNESGDSYPALLSILPIAPGETLDLSDKKNSEVAIDIHGLVFGMMDLKNDKSAVAQTSEIQYQVNGEIKSIKIENTLAETHVKRLTGYMLDHSCKISQSPEFVESYKQECATMPESAKNRLVLYTQKRPLAEKDTLAALYSMDPINGIEDEETKCLNENFSKTIAVIHKLFKEALSKKS